jgi:hypothetical protein
LTASLTFPGDSPPAKIIGIERFLGIKLQSNACPVPPTTLSEWAKFDFIGSKGPWVRENTYKMVESFKFYNRYAWGSEKESSGLLRNMSRWRCNNNNFKFPFEKVIIDKIFPQQELS